MPEPSEPPPSYETATHETRNGIPPQHRRSMEDEHRSLPSGWVRQFDSETLHQFFVDTKADPPRSIWHHPYDDETYLSSLDPAERQHITRMNRSVSLKDIEAETSDEEDHAGPSRAAKKVADTAEAGGAATHGGEPPKGVRKYGRKLKDKLTSSTHGERELERQQRAEQERRSYEAHMAVRRAMQRAMETGEPQFACKDSNGKNIYIEPPRSGYGVGGFPGSGGRGGMMYSPYSQGVYADPNARFFRPAQPYARPYGYGYGGGMGLPLMGGLLGGALIGGALF
ncbi:hypothetical protein K402DRAFT_389115 [Aulographum hederae CBS 113979]|uniref:WW domain-containing protein n=1 Tax=Aulographum hederae CBS 113979 TaxID=1176131 RepID=A0A6G1HF74_9PEZI|nr:hypothetical protein K402DRAFT_389115 [Aulographum hederae CBS 113979]